MDCSAVEKGVAPDSENPTDENNAYKIKLNCLKYKEYYIHLQATPEVLRKNTPVPMSEGGDGVYTFIFAEDRQLYSARVFNRMEIGSLHITLEWTHKVKRVLAAGEMEVVNGQVVQFNLLSGSFMKQWMEETLEGKCDAHVISQTKQLFLEAGHPDATYTAENLIKPEKNVKLSKQQLDMYLKKGFRIRLFKSKEVCMVDPNILRAKIKYWEQNAVANALVITEAETKLRMFEEQGVDYTGKEVGGRRRGTRRRRGHSLKKKKV